MTSAPRRRSVEALEFNKKFKTVRWSHASINYIFIVFEATQNIQIYSHMYSDSKSSALCEPIGSAEGTQVLTRNESLKFHEHKRFLPDAARNYLRQRNSRVKIHHVSSAIRLALFTLPSGFARPFPSVSCGRMQSKYRSIDQMQLTSFTGKPYIFAFHPNFSTLLFHKNHVRRGCHCERHMICQKKFHFVRLYGVTLLLCKCVELQIHVHRTAQGIKRVTCFGVEYTLTDTYALATPFTVYGLRSAENVVVIIGYTPQYSTIHSQLMTNYRTFCVRYDNRCHNRAHTCTRCVRCVRGQNVRQ